MRRGEFDSTARDLQDIPEGIISVERCRPKGQGEVLFTEQFQAITSGKGRMTAYSLFSGIEASFNIFGAPEIKFRHSAASSVLAVYYCHSGRVGWNMRGGTAVYLGAGDLTAHSMTCCADSTMMFPLSCPEILSSAGVQADRLQQRFCSGQPSAIPACPDLEHVFAPLFSVPPAARLPMLKLKVQELLIYLNALEPAHKQLTQYFSRQTELIKEIHQELTGHLEQRFTIEELSRRYLINTSTLKEVFKAVYGLPIATYMKEYRIHQAMKLLRETDDTIADIAARVGYETQGKFSRAFKDVVQVLPTEYRKMQRQNFLEPD